jgi:hypothetical protein
MPGLSHYQLHLFSEFDSFKNALHHVNFFSLIYSFPMREKSVVTAWRTCGIWRLRMAISSALFWFLMRWKHG